MRNEIYITYRGKTENYSIYSDSKALDLIQFLAQNRRIGFLKETERSDIICEVFSDCTIIYRCQLVKELEAKIIKMT